MNLHFTIAELDACRNKECNLIKRWHCRIHLLFCEKCQSTLQSLKDSDDFLASIKSHINRNEA